MVWLRRSNQIFWQIVLPFLIKTFDDYQWCGLTGGRLALFVGWTHLHLQFEPANVQSAIMRYICNILANAIYWLADLWWVYLYYVMVSFFPEKLFKERSAFVESRSPLCVSECYALPIYSWRSYLKEQRQIHVETSPKSHPKLLLP